MKIRTDFITNSSSSAFVIIGAKIEADEDYNRLWELEDEYDLHFFGEEGIVGRVLADLDYESYGGKKANMDLSEVERTFDDIQSLFNELGIKGEVRLIADIFAT